MAGFTPEHADYQALLYRISSQVAGIFSDAETRLAEQIARRLARHLEEVPDLSERLQIIHQLEGEADRLTAGITRELAEDIVSRASQGGAASVVQLPGMSLAGFTSQNALAATLVAWDLGNKFADMRARILRYPRDAMGQFIAGGDVYQQVIANHAAQVPLGASTAMARRSALIEFLDRGVTGFTDVTGRNWRIGTYSEMATRTAVQRAYQDAQQYTATAAGIDLFSVLGGNSACDKCAAWFGKIISSHGPSGSRLVPHSFEDHMIQVNIAGTVDDWRASGAGHPNCSCLLVTYLPGFSIPTAASGYNPAAHAARDRLRELEVRERDAKRRMSIAAAAGDDVKTAQLKRRVLDIQAETRAHVAKTGERRRYDRAQPKFADGNSDPHAEVA